MPDPAPDRVEELFGRANAAFLASPIVRSTLAGEWRFARAWLARELGAAPGE